MDGYTTASASTKIMNVSVDTGLAQSLTGDIRKSVGLISIKAVKWDEPPKEET